MARTLKRRSDALLDDQDDSPDGATPPPRRRQRSSSASSSRSAASNASEPGPTQADEPSSQATLVKKLVRLALAAEYSRTVIRRADISTKVLGETHSRGFKRVFEDAQKVLKDTFGMQLVELPMREKTSLKDRRAQATQTKASAAPSKSWILVSILPAPYRSNADIVQPSRAPTVESESTYTALYTFILALIYLNAGSLAEAKLERYLKRVNADTYTPLGTTEKLLQRMTKDGYVEKRRDTSSGEEIVEWVAGGRGKIGVGALGVAGLVRLVYTMMAGDEGADDIADLDEKLERSLGIKLRKEDGVGEGAEAAGAEAEMEGNGQEEQQTRRRGRTRRALASEENSEGD